MSDSKAAVERTFSIIKPDAVAKNVIGEIVARFEKAGLRVVASRMTHLSRAEAEGFYAVHKARPFFKDLVEFMISGPVVLQVLEGENAIQKNRDLMGATDPRKAAKGTIRADFAQSIDANAVHGSDAPETAAVEIAYFFPQSQVHSRYPGPARVMTARANLLDFTLPRLTEWFAEQGEKAFRAKQVFHWIHQRGVGDFDAMTDLAKSLREKLRASAEVRAPAVLSEHRSEDGTVKWLYDVGRAATESRTNGIETVFIPEDDRGTLCVSSQVGCALACGFCSTGRQGFNRDLGVAEIVGQVWQAARRGLRVTNVVMMGMGEPLNNFVPVVDAMSIMLDDHAYGLSRRRVTLSTSGVVPQIRKLKEALPVALAVSLHAPNDAIRSRIMPVNDAYPIAELLAACRDYLEAAPRDFITFEYVMLKGVNDAPDHARELARLLSTIPSKVNLIPFNPFPDSGFEATGPDRVRLFQKILIDAGFVATVRRTRGDDIDAACGQLAGQVVNRMKPRAVRFHSPSPRS